MSDLSIFEIEEISREYPATVLNALWDDSETRDFFIMFVRNRGFEKVK